MFSRSGWVTRGLGAVLVSGCMNGHASDAGSVSKDSSAGGSTKTPAPWVVVTVDDEHVAVDRALVAHNAKAVHAALAQRQDQNVGLAIELRSERDRSLAEAVLSETGWRERVLRADAFELQLESRSLAADTGTHPIIVFASLNEGSTELWRLDTRDESTGSLPTVKAGEAESASTAAAQLAQLCHGDLCSALVVLAPAIPIVATLKEWQRLAGNIPVQLNFAHEFKAPPGKSGPATTVSGRLAPEAIQTIVRRHFRHIRSCYEPTLAKDPQARGRITVKFVIDREGKVASAENAGSTLPDADLNTCIIGVFRGMSFPPPHGGIVTVVYPIELAPG
jgi:hypothetical protein